MKNGARALPWSRIGEVYCRLVDGAVRKLDQGYAFSNGLVVPADNSLLIVAETFSKRLFSYGIDEPGRVSSLWRFEHDVPGQLQYGLR